LTRVGLKFEKLTGLLEIPDQELSYAFGAIQQNNVSGRVD
jgi:hypothetical protein